jgi:gas vesicle protein
MATKNSTFLIGLVTAAAAGAVIGLLMAPKKGSEVRKDILDKVNDLSDQVKRMGRKARGHFDNLQEDLYDMRSEAKSTIS